MVSKHMIICAKIVVQDGLEEGWNANRNLLNEGNHNDNYVLYYIDVNYDLSGV